MKKLLAVVLCLMMAATLVSASAEGIKTGVAAVAAVSPKDATENKDGQIRHEVTFAAVTVDGNGVITACAIDSYRADVKFSAKGEITSNPEPLTKNEMGEAYGMGAAAPKGEWNVQAAGFAAYCVGKTADQIRGIAVGEDGKTTDADLAATTTIGVGDFIEVVALAAEKATERGAGEGDTLCLTSFAETSSSKAATENKDGTAQLDAYYAAVTLNGDVITSIMIDSMQPKATFSAEGKVTSDTAEKVLSKLEKGDAYGMGGVAPKGEWYQQTEGFCAYVTGKTLAEAAGIAVGEDGKTTDADLAATTTIGIGDFLELLRKIAK